MHYIDTKYFNYRNNILYCEDVDVRKLAEEFGTPLYIYSKKYFTDVYNNFTEAFKDVPHKIFYAVKANFNLNVMKIFTDLGSNLDVNSAGELYRALRVINDPKRIILSGVGKTDEEIRLALEKDILLLKAESLQEIEVINEIAGKMHKIAPVAIRVNPDVKPETHPYISTGQKESKFGIDNAEAMEIYKDYKKFKNIEFTGMDMHIGSQIKKVDPFVEATERMSEMFLELKSFGVPLEHLDMGGGYAERYLDEEIFTLKELADSLAPIYKKMDCDVFFEPGRSFTGNGGVLISKVLYTKKKYDKSIIVCDAAMTDLLRPSIYGAYHHIQPVVKQKENEDIVADIVGPVCESGDFLAQKREIESCDRGDLISAMTAGAYGMAMSSNYNGRRRGPEIIVDGDSYYVTRGRETYDHLMFDEAIVDDLHK